MRGLPDLIFIVDQQKELIAIQEANTLRIPVIAITDTNCDPTGIDFVVPGNDDASKSIKINTEYLVASIKEGLADRKRDKDAEGEEEVVTNVCH